MYKKIFPFILMCFLLAYSCQNTDKKVFKKKYYKSGKLESSGYYLKDSIPIDTLVTLYENGNQKSIEVYNFHGKLNGIIKTYYDNGKIYHEIPYENGIINGFVHEYDSSGNLYSKEFYYMGKQFGDLYIFKKSLVSYYSFFDFYERKINHIEYDSSGKLLKNVRQAIFIDTIKVFESKNLKKPENYYELLLIISNPPKCVDSIFLRYYSIDKNLIVKDTITGYNCFYYRKEILPDTLDQILIFAKQYDSILNKTLMQKRTINVEN